MSGPVLARTRERGVIVESFGQGPRRDRLRDQLMTRWMQLLELDTRVARATPVDPELTGQVRALGRELARAGDALSEAERLITPSREAATPV